MDIAGMAYRLVGTLPVVAVMIFGVWLAFQHRWKNPRSCTLLGIAFLLAIGNYTVLPVIAHVAFEAWVNHGGMGDGNFRLFSFVQTIFFSLAWIAVWGFVLLAVFGRDGLLQPRAESDDEYD